MPDMDLGDVTIHYEEAGEGPLAYVFCHGVGSDSTFGSEFVDQFDFWKAKLGRVVTWDNRGMGRSSEAASYSLPLYASYLARLLDGLGISKAVVHGVSWGGVVALQFALDHLERCAAIIIDSSSAQVNEAAAEAWHRQSEADRQDSEGGRSFRPENRASFAASARVVAGLWKQPLTPRLHEVTCPALVVAGGEDTVTRGPGGSVLMSRSLPGSRLEIFQGAGHGIYREKAEEFRALAVEFCREHGIIAG